MRPTMIANLIGQREIWPECSPQMEDLAKRHQFFGMMHKDRTPRGRVANGCRRRVQAHCRAALEKFVEQTLDEDNWINCACWVQPARCFRKYGCIQGMAEVPGTIATHVSITGHWNGFPDFQETIHGDPGPPRRLHAKTRAAASRTAALKRRTGA